MKRSGFKRVGVERRPVSVTRLTRPVHMVRADACPVLVATPKHEYVRSPALMKAYRLIACQRCGRDDGTVCGAHSNWAEHGKGRSIKADDNRAASLCFDCHAWLDQGSAPADQKRAAWDEAHERTVRELVGRGLWPATVPVPGPVKKCAHTALENPGAASEGGTHGGI